MEEKIKWFCSRCTDAVENTRRENRELKQINNQLRGENQGMKRIIDKLGERIDRIERGLDLKIERIIASKIEEAMTKKEKQIAASLEEAHHRYDESHRKQVKQLGKETIEEMRKFESKGS